MITSTHAANTATTDPRHTFLVPKEVFARYRWGRTKGYEQLKSDCFPRDIAGAYRLDLLMAWEDKRLADQVPATLTTDTDAEAEAESVAVLGAAPTRSGADREPGAQPAEQADDAAATLAVHGNELDLPQRRNTRRAKKAVA